MENLKKPKVKAKSHAPPDRLLLRLPHDLRKLIEQEAKNSGRSMTAEILIRLETAYRFHLLQIEEALRREYIISRQVKRAIKNALQDSSLESVSKKQEKSTLRRLYDAVKSLATSSATASIIRLQSGQIDLVLTDLVDENLSEKITTRCWQTKIALGQLIVTPIEQEDYRHAQDVRNNLTDILNLMHKLLEVDGA
jgi:hypothetical protein